MKAGLAGTAARLWKDENKQATDERKVNIWFTNEAKEVINQKIKLSKYLLQKRMQFEKLKIKEKGTVYVLKQEVKVVVKEVKKSAEEVQFMNTRLLYSLKRAERHNTEKWKE